MIAKRLLRLATLGSFLGACTAHTPAREIADPIASAESGAIQEARYVIKDDPGTPPAGGEDGPGIGVFVPRPVKTAFVECDAVGTCRVKGMPMLLQTDPGLDASYAAEAGVGCYLTSITMVESAALLNRIGNYATPGRTGQLLATLNLGGVESAKNTELVRFQYDIHIPNPSDYFYFFELIANHGGITAKVPSNCNPLAPDGDVGLNNGCTFVTGPAGLAEYHPLGGNAPVVNETFIAGVKDKSLYVLAFEWEHKTSTRSKTTYDVAGGHHKVAVSGYRPGPFPIVIHDPGSGAEAYVRIGTLNASPKLALPNGATSWSYLEYESAPGQYNLLDAYDRLKIL